MCCVKERTITRDVLCEREDDNEMYCVKERTTTRDVLCEREDDNEKCVV